MYTRYIKDYKILLFIGFISLFPCNYCASKFITNNLLGYILRVTPIFILATGLYIRNVTLVMKHNLDIDLHHISYTLFGLAFIMSCPYNNESTSLILNSDYRLRTIISGGFILAAIILNIIIENILKE